MNNKEFFERAIPVMLEKYPCPDRSTILRSIKERTDDMNGHKKLKISKKFIIIPVIMLALIALTGAVIYEVYTIGYNMSDIVTELKVGRYYLETVDGYDADCYIEVYGDNTLQFFGIEQKDNLGDGNYYDWNSAPVEYRLMEKIPFIRLNDARDSLHKDDNIGGIGIEYRGENTLWVNVNSDEHPDAKDYTPEEYRDTFSIHNTVRGHFVYEAIDQ